MAVTIVSVSRPASTVAPFTVTAYDPEGNEGAIVTAIIGDAADRVYSNGFVSPFDLFSTLTGSGTLADPWVFTIRHNSAWPANKKIGMLVDSNGFAADPQYEIPPSLAVGKSIHYYPLPTDDDYAAGGITTTIASVVDFNQITVNRPGGGVASAYRGGTHRKFWGAPGSFDRLDTRHRRRIRWHLSYAETFADNLIADSSLIARYKWDEYDYDLVVQDPDGQQVVFDRTVDKYRTLGFNVNFGFIPIAAAHPDPLDTSNGIVSIWANPDFWEPWAERLETYYNLSEGRLDGWYHNQMEEAFSEQAIASNVIAAGLTREDIRNGMSSFTGVIAAHGSPVIVRPISSEDWGLLSVLEAGAPGSIYCAENDGFSGRQYRRSTFNWRASLGANRSVWAAVRAYAPANTFPTQFHYESDFKMCGRRIRRDYAKESDRYPILELTMLNEKNGAINVPDIGKTNWWRHTTLVAMPGPGPAPVGTTASANDFFQYWCVWSQPEDGMNVLADDACGTCHDQVAGFAGPSGLRSWRRQAGPSVDGVETTRPFDSQGRGWATRKDFDHANQADCWRIDVGSTGLSFTLRFRAILPAVAPAPGVTWGIAGQTASNSSQWVLVWDGTSGNIELRVRDTVGQQTFTYQAAPTPGADIVFIVSYDKAASATGKWWTTTGWVTPNIVMNVGNAAPLIGCAHDLLDRANVVWGIPNMVLPHDSDIVYWLRALTDAEITYVRANRVPYGGYL